MCDRYIHVETKNDGHQRWNSLGNTNNDLILGGDKYYRRTILFVYTGRGNINHSGSNYSRVYKNISCPPTEKWPVSAGVTSDDRII